MTTGWPGVLHVLEQASIVTSGAFGLVLVAAGVILLTRLRFIGALGFGAAGGGVHSLNWIAAALPGMFHLNTSGYLAWSSGFLGLWLADVVGIVFALRTCARMARL